MSKNSKETNVTKTSQKQRRIKRKMIKEENIKKGEKQGEFSKEEHKLFNRKKKFKSSNFFTLQSSNIVPSPAFITLLNLLSSSFNQKSRSSHN